MIGLNYFLRSGQVQNGHCPCPDNLTGEIGGRVGCWVRYWFGVP